MKIGLIHGNGLKAIPIPKILFKIRLDLPRIVIPHSLCYNFYSNMKLNKNYHNFQIRS